MVLPKYRVPYRATTQRPFRGNYAHLIFGLAWVLSVREPGSDLDGYLRCNHNKCIVVPNEIVIDFETANPTLDLSEVGSTAYSKHPLTEILCLGCQLNGCGLLWAPAYERRVATQTRLEIAALDPRIVFIAHNVGFEKDIWRNIMVPCYGFPDIPNHRWHDTMAVAYLRGLPGSLEKLLIALGLPGKDMAGSKLTRSLSRFKKGYLDRRPETLQRVYQYCMKDVADEVAVHSLLGYLPPTERTIWEIDQEINERGLMFDLPMVQGAQKIYQAVAPVLAAEFEEITGLKPTQTGKFKDWLSSQGVELPNLRKETLVELIGDEDGPVSGFGSEDVSTREAGTRAVDALPRNVRRALNIRALIASSSVSKYARMEGCIDQDSGRIYRLLQYHGAGTGRWAGRLLNPHNMPRGIVRAVDAGSTKRGPPTAPPKLIPPNAELLAKAITSGEPAQITALGLVKDDRSIAHPIEVLASALRNTVIARDGHVFLIGDWSNIEARLCLAIAGQKDKIALMVSGSDVYLNMACQIYHDGTLTKADVEKRQTGKNTVLGCGFQMGWPKFMERYCPKETPQFAKGVVDAYRNIWAPQVPLLWRGLQGAALSAVQRSGSVFGSHGIEYRVEGSWLVGHCPDGSCLYYYRPTLCRQKPRWKEITPEGGVIEVEGEWTEAWRFQKFSMGGGGQGTDKVERSDGQWSGGGGNARKDQWTVGYGGFLTENYIQHMARQILCGALREAKRQGLPVVLHNQDELVLEVPGRLADANILKQIMEQQPEWLKPYAVDPDGNPLHLIQAECFEPCTRYHK